MNREHYSPSILTPDLAKDNPELFKEGMLRGLGTHVSERAWKRSVAKGLASPEHLILDSSQWISHSDAKDGITIGTAEIPDEIKKLILFEDQNFDYSSTILYRLSHEISHKFSYSMNQTNGRFASLFQTAVQLRTKGRGFSGLGSLEFYARQGADKQATEDVVELTNMYLWDPEYLHRFLELLTQPDFSDLRKTLNLTKLSEKTAENIFNLIRTSIESELNQTE
jgi:hypothetical protein